MKLRPSLAFISVFAVVLAACASRMPAASSEPHTIAPKHAAVVERLRAYIEHEMASQQIPALSVALVDGDTVAWSQGFGLADPAANIPATADTAYRIGSMGAVFTDVAVMQQVEQGRLTLDAPVSAVLSAFRLKGGSAPTLRQLMAKRSGLPREAPVGHLADLSGATLAQTVASLRGSVPVSPAETVRKESNAASAVVAAALETAAKTPFEAAVQRAVFASLEMKSTGFSADGLAHGEVRTMDNRKLPAPVVKAPAMAMVSTALDLGRFASAILAGGAPVLKPESLSEMTRVQYGKYRDDGDGLGFFMSSRAYPVYSVAGAAPGYSSLLWIAPDAKLAIVLLASLDSAKDILTRMATYALLLERDQEKGRDLTPASFPTDIAPAKAKVLEGRYAVGDDVFELTERAGALFYFDPYRGQQRLRETESVGLVTDDRAPRQFITLSAGKKLAVRKPKPAQKRYQGLVGEYGWDHQILYVFEKDGALWTLNDWVEFNKLEARGADFYAFPERLYPGDGLHAGETLHFTREPSGRATSVSVGGVVYPRRNVGPGDGGGQLKIVPLRPVPELIAEALEASPPVEQGEFRQADLVELAKLDPTIRLDIRYATDNNFLSAPFYTQPRAFMQRPAAQALLRAHQWLKTKGYGLLIHDAYRPWYVTKVFYDATPDDKKMFVADPAKGSRHNRGCAVDLSMYELSTGKPVEMVATYDETTDRSHADYPGGTGLQRWHRGLLRDAMESEGFAVYEFEWWHFDFADWKQYRIGNQRFEEIQ